MASRNDGMTDDQDKPIEYPPRQARREGTLRTVTTCTELGTDEGFGRSLGKGTIRGSSASRIHESSASDERAMANSAAYPDELPPPYPYDSLELPMNTTTAGYVARNRNTPTQPVPPATSVPRMNIVIFIVGSRGDVQPYVALARLLITQNGHRVRIVTHSTFRELVLAERSYLRDISQGGPCSLEGNLEFFDAGGDPKSLMAYMVKNPGLLPGIHSVMDGDVGRKRRMTSEMLDSISGRPFAADAVISNPPAFAHFHVAEALGIPLHMSFTMPWTASSAFPHPLVGSSRPGADRSTSNYLGFSLADNLMWQGLGGQINHFRKRQLLLGHLHRRMAPSVLDELRIPWTYCWSPDLLPKPRDWRDNIDISGFYFLDTDVAYTPPPDLSQFLAAGSPPIYIGFGSIPIPNADTITNLLVKAISGAGVRGIISSGWAGLGKNCPIPAHTFILTTDVPHEWLFSDGRVAGVVHHGGAGTTATGLRYGRPTAIIPFFGDQKFWGDAVYGAGAGPSPIPFKLLELEAVTNAIQTLCDPAVIAAAEGLGQRIRSEKGEARGADSFHHHLPLYDMRCDLDDTLVATLYSHRHELRLSAESAGVLLQHGIVQEADLIPYRSREYDTGRHNFDPLRGLAYGVSNATVTAFTGFGQLGYRPWKGLRNLLWGTPRDLLAVFSDLYEGFDNLPHIMGSTTRQHNKVTGFGNGWIEGGRRIGWGLYDGAVGLVSDPLDGALREGPKGFFKGCARGALNLIFRPTAGILGLIVCPGEGAVRSARKLSSGVVDPLDILREPRIASAKSTDITEERQQVILSRFEAIKGLVKERKKRRKPTRWLLMKNKTEREAEKRQRRKIHAVV